MKISANEPLLDDILEKLVGFASPLHKSFVTKSKIDDIVIKNFNFL